jgi:shikimate dehydrogenase
MTVRKLLLGLIGSGIQRSLTPGMHEAEGRHHGLAIHYQLIELAHSPQGAQALPSLLEAARVMGFAGLNITFPCKQAVIPLLDGVSDEARAMGAVNTVVFRNGRAVGHNTDGSGYLFGLQRGLGDLSALDRSHVVLLGAGGAGAAIAHAMLRSGTQQLTVVEPDAERRNALLARLQLLYGADRADGQAQPHAALARASGLIHATPTGMDKLPGLPLDASLLRPALWVSEIVYFPIETALLKAARERGCRTVDGGGMAIGQAVDAFGLFTGVTPDAQRMEANFRALLAAREQVPQAA